MVGLIEALTRARQAITPQEDWVLLRIDRDDRSLEIYWSEPNAPYYRTSISQNSSGAQPDGSLVTRGWGNHAEMNMIRDFHVVVGQYQANHGGAWPAMIEVFISRSPCSRSPADNANGIAYPIGCGAKLRTLITNYPMIAQWRIIFDEFFKGSRMGHVHDAQAILSAHGVVSDLNMLPNVEARKFNPFIDAV